MPSVLVDPNTPAGFPFCLLLQLIGTGVTSALALLFRFESPTHPSVAARQRTMTRARTQLLADDASTASHYADFYTLLTDWKFVKLMTGFGIGLGLFNGITTVILQLVQPSGYNSNDAGVFGALIIGGGLVGAAIAGPVMDATHAFKPLCKICAVIAFVGTLIFVLALRPGQGTLVTVAFGIMGFAMMPLLPISFETAVEFTYPIEEETSSCLLMAMGNIMGVVFVYLLAYLITLEPTYVTVFTPCSIFIVVMTVLCIGCYLFLEGDYKRHDEEERVKLAAAPQEDAGGVAG